MAVGRSRRGQHCRRRLVPKVRNAVGVAAALESLVIARSPRVPRLAHPEDKLCDEAIPAPAAGRKAFSGRPNSRLARAATGWLDLRQ